MIKKDIIIINKLGLHARAAAKLAATSSHFACSIRAGRDGKFIDVKSVMSLMLLAAGQGTQLAFEFDGEDEAEAYRQIGELISNFFGEGE
jgi:phosphocarrier protein HPr